MSLHRVVLLLGSNSFDPGLQLEIAIARIEKMIGNIQKRSGKIWNPAVEFESNQIFCNIAVEILTDLSPVKLLKSVKSIEFAMGRESDSYEVGYYTNRVIDIDIVAMDDLRFFCARLVLPHEKHVNERAFSKKLLTQINFYT